MPTYAYSCTKCGDQLEVYQSFTEEPLKRHDACGGRLEKVFSPVGIVLRGSGFYKTDSRAASKAKSKASESAASSSDGKSDSGAGSKSDSKSDSTTSDSSSKRDTSSKPTPSKPAKKSA